MGPIYHSMVKFFLDDDWKFTPIEGKPVLTLGFSGKNGSWNCFAQANEDRQQFLFYSICSAKVPENRRHAMSEFITRANYGLIIGNFEMDFSDGEIRYKTSVDVGNEDLSQDLIRPMVYVNLAMMDKYLPGIMAVTFGGVTPAQAIKDIEG